MALHERCASGCRIRERSNPSRGAYTCKQGKSCETYIAVEQLSFPHNQSILLVCFEPYGQLRINNIPKHPSKKTIIESNRLSQSKTRFVLCDLHGILAVASGINITREALQMNNLQINICTKKNRTRIIDFDYLLQLSAINLTIRNIQQKQGV